MKKYLLDTHILIWSILDTAKLSNKVKDILLASETEILVSAVNYWEISIKYSLGKLDLEGIKPNEIPKLISEMGFIEVPLLPREASDLFLLKSAYHKDPFDRMLIWQSIVNQITLITDDRMIHKYKIMGLQCIG